MTHLGILVQTRNTTNSNVKQYKIQIRKINKTQEKHLLKQLTVENFKSEPEL